MTPFSRLHIIEDGVNDRTIEISGTATIGRDSDSDIVVEEMTVSRSHALLFTPPDGGLVLIDLGSTNGSFVNGIQAPPDEIVWLDDGDVITLGQATLRYHMLSPAIAVEA